LRDEMDRRLPVVDFLDIEDIWNAILTHVKWALYEL
jgi:hypothetical protein